MNELKEDKATYILQLLASYSIALERTAAKQTSMDTLKVVRSASVQLELTVSQLEAFQNLPPHAMNTLMLAVKHTYRSLPALQTTSALHVESTGQA